MKILYPLLPIDYDSNDESDDDDEDTDMFTQQHRNFIHPEAMSPMVSNVSYILPRKQTDYMKENIDWLMSLQQVGDDLNEDALSILKHEKIEHSEETIDYAIVISYAFKQYSLKRELWEKE